MIFEKCNTCKYFVQYYKIMGLHFRPVTGRCINRNVTKKKRAFNNLMENCEFWEENPNICACRKQRIRDTVYEINDSLHEIIEILNLDKEE